jgi:hypothetical protein
MSEDGASMSMTPASFSDLVAVALAERVSQGTAKEPFDIAVLGVAGLNDHAAADYGTAGATWWLESLSPMRGSVDELERIVGAGPPS